MTNESTTPVIGTATMQADVEVANFPAYRVIRRARSRATVDRGQVRLVAGDKLGLMRAGGDYYDQYSISSVVSYAMEYHEDPIAAVDRARANGHELHWINHSATVLTSHKRPQETLIEVFIGMVVSFEGRLFKIAAAPNDNLKLVPFQFAGE